MVWLAEKAKPRRGWVVTNHGKKDRVFHFWKRRPLAIELFAKVVFEQKLNYIHENPVKAGLVKNAIDYRFSSAKFHETGIDEFKILSNYEG